MKTGIILAGGEAKRAGGREKYLFEYDGETFLERLLSTLKDAVDEIIIVARDDIHCRRFEEICAGFEAKIVPDIRKGLGPVGGLHAGVQSAGGEIIFAVACDMPFVNGDVIRYLFSLSGNCDAVIPRWEEGFIEPLHAVYKRDALERYMHSHKSLSLRDMIDSINSCFVNVNDLRQYDADLKTFTNINNLNDLEKLNNRG
ncbi:molybdenum cofactor guanylyltransferase [Methanomicrobium mobile]|uniref:molybdenum cofactor guanylyltransferase n=1 Tax=Methanomicrobium mobile TaxID=2205 RepID=UPI0005B2C89A|nr:molybdenum cofactor guanylyltransferase [Methanomicrobium mobile]